MFPEQNRAKYRVSSARLSKISKISQKHFVTTYRGDRSRIYLGLLCGPSKCSTTSLDKHITFTSGARYPHFIFINAYRYDPFLLKASALLMASESGAQIIISLYYTTSIIVDQRAVAQRCSLHYIQLVKVVTETTNYRSYFPASTERRKTLATQLPFK